MNMLCVFDLPRAVTSLPKHKSGYWVNVSLVVGTRSAEECQKRYTALYQTRGRTKGKHKAKTSKTDEPGNSSYANKFLRWFTALLYWHSVFL